MNLPSSPLPLGGAFGFGSGSQETINQLHLDLGIRCFKLLALYQPMAVDLRVIVAAVKINSDLERRRTKGTGGTEHPMTRSLSRDHAKFVRDQLLVNATGLKRR